MEQQVNLYQPILGAEKRLFSAQAIGLGLAMLALCLGALAGFAAWRTTRIERAVAAIEKQEAATLALAARANAALKPRESLAELEAAAKGLAADIAVRERALAIVQRGLATASSGFAARLEAIGRRQLDGVWLTSLVLASGDRHLALKGATTDPRLVPAWLAALAQEHALNDSRFDHLSIQRLAGSPPAVAVFELGAPGLELRAEEKTP
jgi:Tfp pilus assembly protein PilN